MSSKYGLIAMEDMENEVPVEAVGTTTVEDVADLPEADIAEMTEVAGDIAGNDTEMDGAVDTIDTLEVVADKMEESIPEGGMDEPAAAALEAFVNLVMKQAGAKKKAGFALESHKRKTTRVKATQESLEQVKAFMKRMWDAIVAGFQRAVEWIMKWVDIVFNATFRLQRRAEAMIKAADLKKGKKASKKIENAGGWIHDLLTNGGLNASSFPKQYSDFCQHTKSASKVLSSPEAITMISDKLISVMDDVADDAKFNDMIVKSAEPLVWGSASSNKQISVPEGMALYEGELGAGGNSIYSLILKDITLETVKSKLGDTKYWIAKSTNYKKSEDAGKSVDPLTPEQVLDVAESVKAQMASYSTFRADCAKIKAVQDKVKTKAKALSTTGKDNKGITENSKVAVKFAKVILSITTNFLAAFRGLDVKLAQASLSYCAASLSLVSGKDEKPDEPAAAAK